MRQSKILVLTKSPQVHRTPFKGPHPPGYMSRIVLSSPGGHQCQKVCACLSQLTLPPNPSWSFLNCCCPGPQLDSLLSRVEKGPRRTSEGVAYHKISEPEATDASSQSCPESVDQDLREAVRLWAVNEEGAWNPGSLNHLTTRGHSKTSRRRCQPQVWLRSSHPNLPSCHSLL